MTVNKIVLLVLLVFIIFLLFSIFILYCDYYNFKYELTYDIIYGRIIQIDVYYYSLYYKCDIIVYVDNHYEDFIIECKDKVDNFISNYDKGSLIKITRVSKLYQDIDVKCILGYTLLDI